METAVTKRSSFAVFAWAARPPLNPWAVLSVAILLPGFGHVLCGKARRGLVMQMFMISFGFVTWHLAAPERDFIGKLAGGVFVYALSIPEAYRIGKMRYLAAKGATEPARTA